MLPWRALTLLLAFGLPVRPRPTNSQSAAGSGPTTGWSLAEYRFLYFSVGSAPQG